MEAVLSRIDDFNIVATDASHVAAARSSVQRLARGLQFDETRSGRLAIAVTEAVTNMLKHAGGGRLVARALTRGPALGVEVLAIDSGPGMEDVEWSSRDGISSTGTPGTGLGAMRRMSDEFELHSERGEGTIVRMVAWDRDAPPGAASHEVGAVCIPKPGESVCGDAWEVCYHAQGATFLVADGLGHGPDASRAAVCAVEALRRHPEASAIRILDAAHGSLRATRGAAVAVMRHDMATNELAFAGVGNIAAVVLHGGERRAAVSHNGIVGHNVHKSLEYRYPWSRGGLLVAHSDGLETHWDLSAHAGLADRHPALIAAALFRDHFRGRDDCTVLVARALQ